MVRDVFPLLKLFLDLPLNAQHPGHADWSEQGSHCELEFLCEL